MSFHRSLDSILPSPTSHGVGLKRVLLSGSVVCSDITQIARISLSAGAAFKFFSGVEAKRAPEWMVKMHLEFVYRIFREPKKQIRRCWGIISSLPVLLIQESKKKKQNK